MPWKEFTVESTNTDWQLNPGHLCRYHTTKQVRFS